MKFFPAICTLAALALSSCTGGATRFPEVRRTPARLPDGSTSLMYSPPATGSAEMRPRGILFLHGGGMIGGSPEMERFDSFARFLASRGHEVLSLRYPLLWQGLDRGRSSLLVRDALRSLKNRGNPRLAIVAVSAGAWIAARALEDGRRNGWDEVRAVERFAGVSPLLSFEAGVLRKIVISLFERASPLPLDAAALPPLFMIQGDTDWLVPPETAEPLCRTKGNRDCTIVRVPGGHFQLHGGRPGNARSAEAMMGFLEN